MKNRLQRVRGAIGIGATWAACESRSVRGCGSLDSLCSLGMTARTSAPAHPRV